MYTKNNNFYFDKNDYLHFNNVRFIIRSINGYTAKERIINNKHKDRIIVPYIYFNDNIASYEICINFMGENNKEPDRQQPKLFIARNKQTNKMLLLYNLKRIMLSIYNTLFLYKSYKYNIDSDCFQVRVFFTNNEFNRINNLAIFDNNNIDLFVNVGDFIKQNNTILSIEYLQNTNISPGKVVISNNIIRTRNITIIYPGLYNFDLVKTMWSCLIFSEMRDNFIVKNRNICTINYYTPFQLLVSFFNNIELFDNIEYACINNRYDLLKYL